MPKEPKKIEPQFDFLNNPLNIGDTIIVKVLRYGTKHILATGKITHFTRLKIGVSYTYKHSSGWSNDKTLKYGRDMIKIKPYLIPTENPTLLDMQVKINERINTLIDSDEEFKTLIESYDDLKLIIDGH